MTKETAQDGNNTVFRLEDYSPTPYAIPKTQLEFELQPDKTFIKAKLDIERRPETQQDIPLVLDGDSLNLVSVSINGTQIGNNTYKASPDKLEIFSPPAEPFSLEITTQTNPETNLTLMGLYRSNGVYCTQCEAEGFRRITYFYDRPDVLSVYTVKLVTDKNSAPILLSNGNLQEKGDLENGQHYAIWHDPHPKPSYLFACVGGDLEAIEDHFQTKDGREVALNIYVEKGKTPRATYAMDSLKRAFAWDEQKFNRVYDLDIFNIVAVSDFNMGAMENKGLNIFNDKCVLADPETETDTDYANVERVIAHEYFHNWTGDRITCRDWFQLCLKEGLTVYRDQEFSSDQRSRPVKRLEDIAFLKTIQFPEDAGPLAHPVRPDEYAEINNFYTTTVYEKGAEIVRMVATILGDEAFQKGINLYFERHDGQACTIEDFIQCFADSSDHDFDQFMLWYKQAGTPKIEARYSYNKETKSFTLHLKQSLRSTQSSPNPKPMFIPIRFGLVGSDGQDIKYQNTDSAVQKDLLFLTEEEQSFHFTNIPEKPVPSLLRGLSAPATLDIPLDTSERLFLARRDPGLTNRYQTLHQLLVDMLVAIAEFYQKNNNDNEEEEETADLPVAADDILSLLVDIADDEQLEPAYRALCLTLPAETEIAGAYNKKVNPEAIFAARMSFMHALAEKGANKFAEIAKRHHVEGKFSPNAENAGKRALLHILIHYSCLAANDPTQATELYNHADNMTERLAGLGILVRYFPAADETKSALNDFEQRFINDPLVMDKWFALQASAAGPKKLQAVKNLTQHKLFSYDNPNRVRALIGSFGRNQTGFHRTDGASYRFLADIILQIDKNNPQLASSLLTLMRSWQNMVPELSNNMKKSLQHIADTSDISRNTRDIVERLLQIS